VIVECFLCFGTHYGPSRMWIQPYITSLFYPPVEAENFSEYLLPIYCRT